MRLMKQKAVVLIYTGSSFGPLFSVSAGKTVKLLWGDGQATIINGAVTNITYTHNYAASGVYQFRIIGDLDGITKIQYTTASLSGDIANLSSLTSLTDLRLGNTFVSGDIVNLSSLTSLTYLHLGSTSVSGDIANLSSLTGLATLFLHGTSLSGDIANLSSLTGLATLFLHSTSVSGDIANLSSLTSLTYLHLYSTFVSGDIANLSSLTGLATLFLHSTSVNTYTQGVLPNWDACDIKIHDLGLSQQEVDDFLCDLNTASTASIKALGIHGTNAAPSAVGLACVNDDPDGLRAKGWTVTLST